MCVVVYFANPANLTLSCEIEQTMLTVDSLEIKARQKATIALIRKYGCDDTADAVTQDLCLMGCRLRARRRTPGTRSFLRRKTQGRETTGRGTARLILVLIMNKLKTSTWDFRSRILAADAVAPCGCYSACGNRAGADPR